MSITPKQRADQIMKHVINGKAVNDIFGDALERQYQIYGKSIRDWRSYFSVNVPESATPAQCRAIAAKLASLYQEASFFMAAAEAQFKALQNGEVHEYTTGLTRLVAEYDEKKQRRPGAEVLKSMANEPLLDLKGAVNNAILIKDFWKTIIAGLDKVRKLIDTCTWNNNIELKQEQGQGRIPDYTPRRESYGNGEG